jgi:hypothetical protein
MATSFARVLVSTANGRGLCLRNARSRPDTAAMARRGAASMGNMPQPRAAIGELWCCGVQVDELETGLPQTRL